MLDSLSMRYMQLISPRRLHIEMFPNHYDTPEDVVDDLKDALNYGIFGMARDEPVRVTPTSVLIDM